MIDLLVFLAMLVVTIVALSFWAYAYYGVGLGLVAFIAYFWKRQK